MANQKMMRQSISASMYESMIKYTNHIIMAVLIVLLAASVYGGYMFWVKQKNRSAQKDFGMLMMEYHKVVREKNPDWSTLIEKFQDGYNRHANSALAPCFLAYQARILGAQDKQDEAIELLTQVVTMSNASPLHDLYVMEKALLVLDQADDQAKQVALQELTDLANNVQNQFNDSALFYLGRYYWANDQIELARDVWQRLVDSQRDEKVAASPWVQQVKDNLALTII
jgi:predicted negative regulator of RcsB-dependent stress response